MGVVHLAQRPGERPVALKVLRPHIVGDDEARRRLAREVSSLSRVTSRRVAEIVDADPWGDIPFVATRYVPGLSLDGHVRSEGPIRGADLVWFADCLAEALAAVHEVGVLHRDIKPSNIVMEGRTPILIDFGLARVADDPRLTHTGWLLGTPGYLAPEILYGDDATAASDVHSWGATVAFAGLGRAPFGTGPAMAIMDRVRRGEHDLTGLDPAIRDLVEQTLDPDPSRRPSVADLRTWHRPAAHPAPALTEPLRTAPPLAGPSRTAPSPTAPLGPESWEDSSPRTTTRWPESAPLGPESWEDSSHRTTTRWPDGAAAHDPTMAFAEDRFEPAAPRAGTLERLRRAVLTLTGLGVVAASVALAPYVAILVLALLVWLLRSGSLAASAVGLRRRNRGARWYDGVQVLLAAPWHVVAAIPGALLLISWSLGLALAAALLCFAADASLLPSLAVIGAVLGTGLWWGPGGRRVRGPVQRLTHPASARGVPWFFAAVLTLAAASGLGAAASAQGPVWAPATDRPFADVNLPPYLQP